ncbi:MAG: class II aldolase/adducin family protein [Pseudomonadota bacterium]
MAKGGEKVLISSDCPKGGGSPVTREVFCHYCRLLYDRHLVTGVGGNLSVRVGNKFFITPSGLSLRDITPDAVVVINEAGKVLDGGIPTKDMEVHLGLLHRWPDINVVCHLHGDFIIAASSLMKPGPHSLPPVTPGFVYFAHPLPMIGFQVPGSKALAKAVAKHFSRKGCRALLLQNHGLITVGKSFLEAINIAEEIDEAARIFVLTNGRARVISEDGIKGIKSLPDSK